MGPFDCAAATLPACRAVLQRLAENDLSRPTPCAEYTVGDVGQHVVRSMVLLASVAGEQIDSPAAGTLEEKVATTAEAALAAWRCRGLDGSVAVGRSLLPASLAPRRPGLTSRSATLSGQARAPVAGARRKLSAAARAGPPLGPSAGTACHTRTDVFAFHRDSDVLTVVQGRHVPSSPSRCPSSAIPGLVATGSASLTSAPAPAWTAAAP